MTAHLAPVAWLVTQVGEPSPAPGQAPSGGLESWEVSPGLLGFLPVFLIALACVGLFLSLTRHLRRVTVRQALRDADDEAAARDSSATPGSTGSTGYTGSTAYTGPGGHTGPGAAGAPGGAGAAGPDGPGDHDPGEGPSGRR